MLYKSKCYNYYDLPNGEYIQRNVYTLLYAYHSTYCMRVPIYLLNEGGDTFSKYVSAYIRYAVCVNTCLKVMYVIETSIILSINFLCLTMSETWCD